MQSSGWDVQLWLTQGQMKMLLGMDGHWQLTGLLTQSMAQTRRRETGLTKPKGEVRRGEALDVGVKNQLGNQYIVQKEEKKGNVAHKSQDTQGV
ncbi:hypothetical protein DUI87_14133 [Hirundo rustica rustica]|uniref:Uncharacterized protein n=1 Tax=Hirundo rustica rustica TaxID=333673 RepID=A0A3M0K7E0_HIRRU|nr:hypothetical protein DUI87_14133 [Hirundo rustica rustica]